MYSSHQCRLQSELSIPDALLADCALSKLALSFLDASPGMTRLPVSNARSEAR